MIKPMMAAAMAAVSIASIAIQSSDARAIVVSAPRPAAVYTATNDPAGNSILEFTRKPDGTLVKVAAYPTGGRGSGGTVDPLQSQNSVVLSIDYKALYVANAGSGDISVFSILPTGALAFDQRIASGGAFPVSLTISGSTLYVLNSSGGSNITGFHIAPDGTLSKLWGANAFLSGANIAGASISFGPHGQSIVALERGTNMLDTFPIFSSGDPGAPTFTPSTGKGLFASTVTSTGVLLVAEAASASVSSYTFSHGQITQVTSSLSTGFGATCWVVATSDGKYAFATDSSSDMISEFSIDSSGALTLLGAVGSKPGSAPLDLSISTDGKFLYSLTAGDGTISEFSIGADGLLTFIGEQSAQPAKSGQNGLAAL